ncbi:hypothetical protein PPL_11255 [Heterostelium album PN500]|uniref:Endoglycoceramidase n=1 Tax=Heterostelium pallidum (strain ATCC 26659 / Pp 5 / PN500) TaxID=670386 RepID=D3BTZ5_HETP5|nr:hypothetical protein PPL_11255 [Heterostelium album PN500]EFA75181.1 hypothetical protein PPL_11255 [Heterostelium album PN500]|eukprot:XP_020427315.1 hypothetical protein PPL_11255 [Heterostelium album PN500]
MRSIGLSKLAFLMSALLINSCFSINPNIVVQPETKRFIDSDGRERNFHGVNVVYKIPPFAPTLDFDVYQSFGPKDMQYLQDWGLNIVRFGVMWAGVAPEARGQYNETYLSYMRNMVDMMEPYGIYALIDSHQDLYSLVYCGDGAPNWAAKPKAKEAFPIPVQLQPFVYDNTTGWPSDNECGKHSWGSYYGTISVSSAFQSLYDNYDGIQDGFIEQWQQIASTFKTSTNTIGYELINEPWAGDIFVDPFLLYPGVADKKNLQPMYDRLNTGIRSIDSEHIIFFESVTWDELPKGVGFDHVPGGDEYRNLSALSYHYYVPPDFSIDEIMDVRMKDLDKLGCAGMLTEFGGNVGDSESVLESTLLTMEAVERDNQGWIFWIYKDFAPDSYGHLFFNESGEPDWTRVKLFSRTYAQAVAGTTINSQFDSTTAKFSLSYTINPACKLPTEIYLNEALYYPNGYSVEFIPQLYANYTSTTNRIFVNHIIDTSQELTVLITAN